MDSDGSTHSLVNESVGAYELLRERCVENHSQPSVELGLSVLLRNGMLAWITTYSRLMSSERTRPVTPDDAQPVAPSRSTLIDLMVAMVTSVSRHNAGVKA